MRYTETVSLTFEDIVDLNQAIMALNIARRRLGVLGKIVPSDYSDHELIVSNEYARDSSDQDDTTANTIQPQRDAVTEMIKIYLALCDDIRSVIAELRRPDSTLLDQAHMTVFLAGLLEEKVDRGLQKIMGGVEE